MPCYRKDDRVMCPIYGCPENFRSPGLQPRLLIPNFLWVFVPIEPINEHTKFEVRIALPVREIIGGTFENWAIPEYVHAFFSPKILMDFCSDTPHECTLTCQIWSQ